MLMTKEGRAIRFPQSDLSVVGRTAQGVRGINLKKTDSVIGLLLIRRDAWVLSVTESGFGKRTEVSDFPLQKRGGLGILATPSEDKNTLVSALEVLEGDEVMAVTGGGRVSRIVTSKVPAQGIRTQGRCLVEVESGDRVVEVTRAYGSAAPPKEEIEEIEEIEEGYIKQLDLLGSETGDII